MLAIRLQRTGRKGHASFRIIVQDSRKSPSSGVVVAYLGSYDPHNKTVILDKEKTENYLKNGANPSPRATSILKSQGIKLPKWVVSPDKKKGKVRNPEKRRSTAPAGTVVEKPAPKEEQPKEAEETKDQPEAEANEPPKEGDEPKPEDQSTEAEASEPQQTENIEKA